MELTEDEFEQIEGYIRETLSEEEQKVVAARMREEPLFLKKVQYQKGVRDFFEARYDEQVFLQKLERNIADKKPLRGQGRIRHLVLSNMQRVAAIALFVFGVGIGWLVFRSDESLKEGLMLSRTISRTVYPNPNSGFADNGPTTDPIVIQIYQDQAFANNTYYYRDDTLTLYNVPAEIRKSNNLSLTYKDQKLRMNADKNIYQLHASEDGRGSLEVIEPQPATK